MSWNSGSDSCFCGKQPSCGSRNAHSQVRLEESETARQSFLPGLFVFRGGEKDFPEKSAKKSKYPLAIFLESDIILKQSFPRPLEGVADIEGCDGHIH